jgi:hypothetical protein
MTKTAAAKNTTTEKATVQCACECGEATQSAKSNYRPGHDARHASNVGRFLATSDDPEANNRALASLGSDKLRAKALAMDSRLRGLAAAKAEREAAKAQGKKAPKWTEAEPVKVGRWTYPARTNGKTTQRNESRDGSGTWINL